MYSKKCDPDVTAQSVYSLALLGIPQDTSVLSYVYKTRFKSTLLKALLSMIAIYEESRNCKSCSPTVPFGRPTCLPAYLTFFSYLLLRDHLNDHMLRKVPFVRVVGRLRVASNCFLFTIIIIESIQLISIRYSIIS